MTLKFSAARLGSVIALAGLALSTIAITPAQAAPSTFDASGIELDFSNSSDLLVNSVNGDTVRYKNVAKIDGTTIDATVTVVATENSIKDVEALYTSAADAGFLGGDWTKGCYFSDAYAVDHAGELLVPATDKLTPMLAVLDSVDPDFSKAISTTVTICGGALEPADGYATIRVEFTTGDSLTPVTLTNLKISALDIDAQQAVTFANPKPSTFKTMTPTELTITENPSSVDFYGATASVDSANQLNWVAEVTYDSVSSLEYSFGQRQTTGSGHLDMQFKGVEWNPKDVAAPVAYLANTGTSPAWSLFAAFGAVLAGLIVVATSKLGRRKKSRA